MTKSGVQTWKAVREYCVRSQGFVLDGGMMGRKLWEVVTCANVERSIRRVYWVLTREVGWYFVGFALVFVRVFFSEGSFVQMSDFDLNVGEFLVAGYFGGAKDRGRDVQKPDGVGL